jgi:hypothetical protein
MVGRSKATGKRDCTLIKARPKKLIDPRTRHCLEAGVLNAEKCSAEVRCDRNCDAILSAAMLDRVPHHATTVQITGEVSS